MTKKEYIFYLIFGLIMFGPIGLFVVWFTQKDKVLE